MRDDEISANREQTVPSEIDPYKQSDIMLKRRMQSQPDIVTAPLYGNKQSVNLDP